MEDNFISSRKAEELFGKFDYPISTHGSVTVNWLYERDQKELNTGCREYQREKIATTAWKQGIMLTVLSKQYVDISQIHIRVLEIPNRIGGHSYSYEVIDGQQRVTSIIGFINGEFCLPKNCRIDNCDISGLYSRELKQLFPSIYKRMMNYTILCGWYENIDDAQTSELFVDVLNNVNDMKPQEIRNAIRGRLSTYIRNTARFENKHILFTTMQTDGKKPKKSLIHFSPKFNLGGRMEIDQWVSELIYLSQNGYKKGIKPIPHTQWIKTVQAENGIFSTASKFVKLKKETDDLLDYAYRIIKSVSVHSKYRLTPWISQFLVLYGTELKARYGSIDLETYTSKFFNIYTQWSDNTKKLWIPYTMYGENNKDPMQPFKELWGGRNEKAIGTILSVLEMELEKDLESFGILEIDQTDFTSDEIRQKWEEQDFKCYFTGEVLEWSDVAGDHYIPRMYGIKRGGTTTYDNLVVTSRYLNLKKLNIHGDDFKKQFEIDIVA